MFLAASSSGLEALSTPLYRTLLSWTEITASSASSTSHEQKCIHFFLHSTAVEALQSLPLDVYVDGLDEQLLHSDPLVVLKGTGCGYVKLTFSDGVELEDTLTLRIGLGKDCLLMCKVDAASLSGSNIVFLTPDTKDWRSYSELLVAIWNNWLDPKDPAFAMAVHGILLFSCIGKQAWERQTAGDFSPTLNYLAEHLVAQETDIERRLLFWAFIGQIFHIFGGPPITSIRNYYSKNNNNNNITRRQEELRCDRAGTFLWEKMTIPTEANLESWKSWATHRQSGMIYLLAHQAMKFAYEFAISCAVPPFEYLIRSNRMLILLGIIKDPVDIEIRSVLALQPVELPDLTPPQTVERQDDVLPPIAAEGLQRSGSLEEREQEWLKTVGIADAVVHRCQVASRVMNKEMQWIEDVSDRIHFGLASLQLISQEQMESLQCARDGAVRSLQILQQAYEKAEESQFFQRVATLKQRGMEIRYRVNELVAMFGPAIGSPELEAAVAGGAQYYVSSIAGGDDVGFRDGSARPRNEIGSLIAPRFIITLRDGSLLFTETRNNSVRMFQNGIITTIIGRQGPGYRDGPAENARLHAPCGLTMLTDGSIAIADTGNHCIRGLSPDLSTVFTFAGMRVNGCADGDGPLARFSSPMGVADAPGLGILVADTGNSRIRLIEGLPPNTRVSTLVGGALGGAAAAAAAAGDVPLVQPSALLVIPAPPLKSDQKQKTAAQVANPPQCVLIIDGNSILCAYRSSGWHVSRVAGSNQRGQADGICASATFSNPEALVIGPNHTIIVSDTRNEAIRIIESAAVSSDYPNGVFPPNFHKNISKGRVRTIAGGKGRGIRDGAGSNAKFSGPTGLCFTHDGALAVCDYLSGRIRLAFPPHLRDRGTKEYQRLRDPIKAMTAELQEQIKNFNIQASTAIQAVQAARSMMMKCQTSVISSAFLAECDRILRSASIKIDTFLCQAIVMASPSLLSLFHLIPKLLPIVTAASPSSKKEADSMTALSAAIHQRIARNQWPVDPEEQTEHLAVFLGAVKQYPHLFSQHALTAIFGNPRLKLGINDLSLELVTYLLKNETPNSHVQRLLAEWQLAIIRAEEEAATSKEGVTVKKSQVPLRPFLSKWSNLLGEHEEADKFQSDEVKVSIKAIISSALRQLALVPAQRASTILSLAAAGIMKWLLSSQACMLDHLPPVLLQLLKDTMKEAVQVVGAAEAFVILSTAPANPKSKRDDGQELEKTANSYSVSLQSLPEDIAFTSEILFYAFTLINVPKTLVEIIESKKVVHVAYLLGMAAVVDPGRLGTELSALAAYYKQILLDGVNSVVEGTASVALSVAVGTRNPHMTAAFKAIGLVNCDMKLAIVRREANGASMDLEVLEDVVKALFTDDPIANEIASLRSRFYSLTIKELQCALRISTNSPDDTSSAAAASGATDNTTTNDNSNNNGNSAVEPLPLIILKAANWLYELRQSQLFVVTTWEGSANSSLALDTRILQAAATWKSVFLGIRDKTLPLSTMQKISHLLKNQDETRILAMTALSVDSEEWSLSSLPENWTQYCLSLSEDFVHVSRIYQATSEIDDALALVSRYVSVEGQKSITDTQDATKQLFSAISTKALDWDALTLQDLGMFAPIASRVDRRIAKMSLDLLRAITDCSDFITWLQTMPSDTNFTSSIEMALGRSEMETPPELWVQEGDGPGHPDEEKLSTLSTIRKYLHAFLYHEFEHFDSLADLLTAFHDTDDTDPQRLAEAIRGCNAFLLPLSELLSDDSDSSAPTRLMNLMQPHWKARWIVCNEIEDNLCLEYMLPRKDSALQRQLTLAELVDFQSTVVLSRSTNRANEATGVIDNFVQQFGWVREIAAALKSLQDSGHFDFRTFRCYFPISDGPEPVRLAADNFRSRLERWEYFASQNRIKYWAVNLFPMQHILDIMQHLKKQQPPALGSPVQVALSSINPELIGNDRVQELEQNLRCMWKQHVTEQSNAGEAGAAERSLEFLSRALTQLLEKFSFSTRLRSLNSPAAKIHALPDGCHATPGAHLIVAGQGSSCAHIALAMYLRAGLRPEWQNCIYCTPETKWEDLCTLLNAWATGISPLHALIHVDSVSYDFQHRIVNLVQKLTPHARRPLLLVAANDDHYITAQLVSRRVVVAPPPIDALRLMSEDPSICVWASNQAGAGKSFAIRSEAERLSATYIRVPISRNVSASEFLSVIRAQEQQAAAKMAEKNQKARKIGLLHIDISDSVDHDLDPALFEVIFLGCLRDSNSLVRTFWQPHAWTIMVEIGHRRLLRSHCLDSISVLPLRNIGPSRNTFCSSRKGLAAGMGYEELTSTHHDGCVAATGSSRKGERDLAKEPNSDAYYRLQFVVTLLQRCSLANGFPTNFAFAPPTCAQPQGEEEEEEEGDFGIPGAECFDILLAVSDQNPSKLSLWSLWNFVNVLYWQLRDMTHPDSPVGGTFFALDPALDVGDGINPLVKKYNAMAAATGKIEISLEGFGILTMSKLQGEVVAFLCRTAVDFSTRRSKLIDPNRIEYVRLMKHSIPYINGYWSRAAFNNDGRPVFRDGTRFLYFRGGSKQPVLEGDYWVIDTEIRFMGPFLTRSEGVDFSKRWVTPQQRRGTIALAAETDFTVTPVTAAEALALWPSEAKPVSLPVEEEDDEQGGGGRGRDDRHHNVDPFADLLRWSESTHESMLISRHTMTISVLSLQPKRTWAQMHPPLLQHLRDVGINVGEDLDLLNTKHHAVLGALTGRYYEADEAAALLGGAYCLTGDVLLKILAVYARIRCGVPVVLMGECGSGKTMMLKYLCSWLQVELIVLDVHGGTTEEDILGVFSKAEALIASGATERVYVFLDEVNTCAHMGLICEALCQRSLWGKPFHEGIRTLAACNPYRRRVKRDGLDSEPGLVFQGKSEFVDPMADLVYRVHPIPVQMQEYVFDFGALDATSEEKYIHSMVSSCLPKMDVPGRIVLTRMLASAQEFIREYENDPSAVSLRDVKRALDLVKWFYKALYKGGKVTGRMHEMAGPMVLGLAHVYYFRLMDSRHRSLLMNKLRVAIQLVKERTDTIQFAPLLKAGVMENFVLQAQARLCSKLEVEADVAMNAALSENLYVVIVCILNRIPIFVVGKPGTSKTLTMQVLASNLQGSQSRNEFWRKFPAVYMFQYQCSPMSSAEGIRHQFQIACNYQAHAEKVITILLLDEVGLAEHSPDMPLKVLHGILIDPPIAIVGLSNWTLDASKMNRAICLRRIEPRESDIQLTGQSILRATTTANAAAAAPPSAPSATAAEVTRTPSSGISRTGSGITAFASWLEPLSRAYHRVYTQQQGRDFIGMRDFYHLVKQLRVQLETTAADLDWNQLSFALCRNFGGNHPMTQAVLSIFKEECRFDVGGDSMPMQSALPSSKDLIQANLGDQHARHLMLLTKNSAALSLMFGCGLLKESSTMVLVGSEFKDDTHELHLVQQINQVKVAMASGATVVLLNHDNIYEALYDVLNQRYVVKTIAGSRKTKKMLRLAIGTRSQLCYVQDDFRIIVIVEQQHAYDHLDLPLLNRFEKQVFYYDDVLGPRQKQVLARISEWAQSILAECNLNTMSYIFCSFHEGSLLSLILQVTNFDDNFEMDEESVLDLLKLALAQIALPVTVLRSHILKTYFSSNQLNLGDFCAAVSSRLDVGLDSKMLLFLTHSPISHLDGPVLEAVKFNRGLPIKWTQLRLSEFSSELQLSALAQAFFGAQEDSILLLQCDPVHSKQSLIDHARQIVAQRRAAWIAGNDSEVSNGVFTKHVIFVVHLPPGSRSRRREFLLDFHRGWEVGFIDDVRPISLLDVGEGGGDIVVATTTTMFRVSPLEMMQSSLHELATANYLDIIALIDAHVGSALSLISTPTPAKPVATETKSDVIISHSYGQRMAVIRSKLRHHAEFADLMKTLMMTVLEKNRSVGSSGMHIQAELAVGEMASGTLRTSLVRVIDNLTTSALSAILKMLDVNFNLSFLQSADPDVCNDWVEMAKSKAICDISSAVATCKLDGRLATTVVANTGVRSPLVARFPFSATIINLIGSDTTRTAVEIATENVSTTEAKLHALFTSIAGEEPAAAALRFHSRDPDAYLHDVVASTTAALDGLSFSVQLRLYSLMVTSSGLPNRITAIHATIWRNDSQLYIIGTLLGCLEDEALQHAVLSECKFSSSTEGNAAAVINAYVKVAQQFVDTSINAPESGNRNLPALLAQLGGWCSMMTKAAEPMSLLLASCAVDVSVWSALCHLNEILSTVVLPAIRDCMEEGVAEGQQVTAILTFITKCNTLALSLKPGLCSSLGKTCAAIEAIESGKHLPAFLSNHIEKLVNKSGEALEIEDKLLHSLVNLVSGETGLDSAFQLGSPLPLSARKSILLSLVKTEARLSDRVIKIIDGLPLSEAAQLYMQLLEDLNLVGKSSNGLPTAEHLRTVFDKSVSESGLVEFLKCVVRIRGSTTEYAQKVIQNGPCVLLEGGNDKTVLPVIARGGASRVLLFRYLLKFGGIEKLVELLAEKALRLVSPQDAQILGDIANVSDPFAYFMPNLSVFSETKMEIEKLSDAKMQLFEDVSRDNLVRLTLALYSVQLRDKGKPPVQNRWMTEWQRLIDRTWNGDIAIPTCHLAFSSWFSHGANVIPIQHQMTNRQEAFILNDFAVHLALFASQRPGSYLSLLVTDPERFTTWYIPGVQDSNFSLADSVLYDITKWYKCPNNHIFTVGNCGMPMETRKCPVCFEEIGGKEHVPARGNRELTEEEMKKLTGKTVQPGYIDEPGSRVERGSYTLSPMTVQLLRLINHTLLLVGALERSKVSKLDATLRVDTLRTKIKNNLKFLAEWAEVPIGDLTFLLQAALFRMWTAVTPPSVLATETERSRFEFSFEQDVVIPLFFSKTKRETLVMNAKREAGESGTLQAIEKCLGKQQWELACEVALESPLPVPLWRVRLAATIPSLLSFLRCDPVREQKHPVLAAFMSQEERLHATQYIADILEWHGFLFQLLGEGRMSRIEAAEKSAEQFLSELEPVIANKGRAILSKFCKAFNACLPLVPLLFECQRNPFLTLDGQGVDLTGTNAVHPTPMAPSTPLLFSLPSQVPGQTDAPGLCTIQILRTLQTAHNMVATVFAKAEKQMKGEETTDREAIVVSVSARTPASYIRKRLIVYDRQSVLLPLLFKHSVQGLGLQQGQEIGYDLEALEAAIIKDVLGGGAIPPLDVNIRHFVFTGEARQRGALSALEAKLPQEHLSSACEEAVTREIDTVEQATELARILEQMINLINSIGAASTQNIIDPDALLQTQVLEVLMVPAKTWEWCCPKSISTVVTIKHLRSLFLAVEGAMSGGPLAFVLHRFRAPLTPELDASIHACYSRLDLNMVLSVLRDLLTGPLSDNDSKFNPAEKLKDFLVFVDLDIQTSPGFEEYFPETLEIRHALSAYKLFSQIMTPNIIN